MRSFLLGAPVEGSFNIPFRVEKAPSWANPYITDGLVAMWDGEWNAGGGVHDATATVWKDLAGSVDLDDIVNNNATWEWTDNGFKHISGVACRFRKVGTTLTYAHAEICIDINVNDAVSWFGGGRSNGFSNYYGYFTANQSTTPIPYVSMENGIKSISFDDISKTFYLNGSIAPNKTVGAGNYKTDGEVYIGNIRSDASTRYRTIHCVRIYNRALTATEVASNYAVDKARFNLS